ncbi:hypothetical protein CGCSCA2_v009715 [Colletotrichum siamense]|uniref:Uncharacterized protein n=1 Tax=Colletotrichum siamense TaxID=690259 RepID=A0A9P5EMC2_COLSI|nr:hypothetical protein CGCSCA2_v009715 [Colletotrichum siamense]
MCCYPILATEWTNYLAVTRRKVQLLHHQTDHVGNTARNSASSFFSSGTRNNIPFGALQYHSRRRETSCPKSKHGWASFQSIAVAPVVVAAPRLVSVVDVVLRLGSTVTSTDEDILGGLNPSFSSLSSPESQCLKKHNDPPNFCSISCSVIPIYSRTNHPYAASFGWSHNTSNHNGQRRPQHQPTRRRPGRPGRHHPRLGLVLRRLRHYGRLDSRLPRHGHG